jgi:hypothetical protein
LILWYTNTVLVIWHRKDDFGLPQGVNFKATPGVKTNLPAGKYPAIPTLLVASYNHTGIIICHIDNTPATYTGMQACFENPKIRDY